ncbi:helix-turn-helix domain-containing protein [Pseudomonas sp. CCM 7891]|uniref:Helix-turn-helix domain-containing protein n=1 Tax=Pseudomonas karstica TaxID=1055468 RepID=A0A7X2UYF9_9PSED|nr:GlxA family transcriptional regulator [Pseudomonas karstica]MTD20771.1 helix-turn-helix domain-containing protein [Pseudomonas karstica]
MHRIGYVLADGFQVMSLASQAVFEYANVVAGDQFYAIENFSVAGGLVRSSLGMLVETSPLSIPGLAETWIFTGVNTPLTNPSSPELLAFARKAGAQARRMAGICTGGFVLAEAGLLADRRATTHWAYSKELQRRHPDIKVEDDRIYIIDGPLWTSAGMTAGLDLALGMLEKDLGVDVARSVAHKLVMHQRRSGGQSQHSELLMLAPKSDRIQSALDYARRNLANSLSVEQLAESVHLSPRQFTRVFTAETGQSPAKAIESLRLEAARLMIEQGRHSLDTIARESGFRDRRHLREVFLRGFGVTPLALRRDARRDKA